MSKSDRDRRWAQDEHHLGFAGTLSLRTQALQMIVHDVVDSLARHGALTTTRPPAASIAVVLRLLLTTARARRRR